MTWELEVKNIGGILDAQTTIEPGMNAVRASNWQGKSSFIAALKTVLGVAKPLMEGEDMGYVRLDGPKTSRTIELERQNDTVVQSGDPLLNAEDKVVRTRLFACLGEENPVRHAVRSRENLEEILMEPLNSEDIDEQIRKLKREREQAEIELQRAKEAKNDAQDSKNGLTSSNRNLRNCKRNTSNYPRRQLTQTIKKPSTKISQKPNPNGNDWRTVSNSSKKVSNGQNRNSPTNGLNWKPSSSPPMRTSNRI